MKKRKQKSRLNAKSVAIIGAFGIAAMAMTSLAGCNTGDYRIEDAGFSIKVKNHKPKSFSNETPRAEQLACPFNEEVKRDVDPLVEGVIAMWPFSNPTPEERDAMIQEFNKQQEEAHKEANGEYFPFCPQCRKERAEQEKEQNRKQIEEAVNQALEDAMNRFKARKEAQSKVDLHVDVTKEVPFDPSANHSEQDPLESVDPSVDSTE